MRFKGTRGFSFLLWVVWVALVAVSRLTNQGPTPLNAEALRIGKRVLLKFCLFEAVLRGKSNIHLADGVPKV